MFSSVDAAIEKAADAVVLAGSRCGTSRLCVLPFCRQQVLVVDPETMLQIIGAEAKRTCSIDMAKESDTDHISLDEHQRAVVERVCAWQRANPWELKKAKSRRAQRSAVRPLCQKHIEVRCSSVIEHLVSTGVLAHSELDESFCIAVSDIRSKGAKRGRQIEPLAEFSAALSLVTTGQERAARENFTLLERSFKALCV